MDVVVSIVITFCLTLANGFFSAAELAVVSARKAILEPEAESGDRQAQKVLSISENASTFLATIQVAITLVGFASSAFAATSLSDPLAQVFVQAGLPSHIAGPCSLVVITLLVSYLSIVIGELVPKGLALAYAERVAKISVGFISGFMKVARPFVWLTSCSAQGILALFGADNPEDRDDVSEEEIKYMVTGASELTDEEKSMIHEVIDLGDTIAREVMIPRVDMTAVEDTKTLEEVLTVMRLTGYSRVPVYHETVDKIVGIAHIKDIIGPLLDERLKDDTIRHHVRSAHFIPDTKDLLPLLSEMQSNHDQMVIVVDEYGGTAGVITIEDIVEEVVGEIEDEFDPDNKYITDLGDGEWIVDGRFSLDDAIDLGWPIEDSEEYETIAGFVTDLADKLPRIGDIIEKDGYQFKVKSTRGRRISTLRVSKLQNNDEHDSDTTQGIYGQSE